MLDKCLPSEEGKGCRRGIALGLLAAAVLLLTTTQSRAGSLQIVVENSAAAPGSTGRFDVVLENDSATAVTIASFSVDVLLSSTASVSLTGIDNSTAITYIYSGIAPSNTTSFAGFQGNLLPMEASGNDTAASAGQVVNPGQSFGLADVTYLVAPGASAGSVSVTLEPDPVLLPPHGGTSLADPTGAPVAFTPVNGTITIQPAVAVPEPATATLFLTSSLILILGRLVASRGLTDHS